MKKPSTRKYIILLIIALFILLVIPGIVYFSQSRFNALPQLIASHTVQANVTTFPEINDADLSLEQQKVVGILREEYKLQPGGTKYSEGVSEAWCADFVSWVFNEAGVPLSNPNSGYWRIPGTYTLRDYYEQAGRFKSAQSGYSPKVGDIMLYDNPSPFGQHTNIVVENTDGIVTTIGGNEPGGIRVIKHTEPDDAGFIGYGVF